MTNRTDREQRVCQRIEQRRTALLEDLRLHVGLPTGGGNTAALDETRGIFRDRLEALGAATRIIPGDPRPDWLYGVDPNTPALPSAVCRRERNDDTPSILIAGHLDTVHDPQGDFLELEIDAGEKRATGPGCVDMKGGLVIAIGALEVLEDAGEDVSWAFFMNSDEETGSFCSEAALASLSKEFDYGIALEPALAGGELAIERGGSGQFMIEARGKSAHVGRAFTEGVSAVTALAECLTKIGDMPDPQRGLIVNVGPIEGGAATNAVPDTARAWGNVRYPNESIASEIGDMLDALATDGLPAIRVARAFNRAAKPLIPATEALAKHAQTTAEDLGQTLPFAKTGGVCDGNIMQGAGLPTIDTMGVRGGGLHTPDEWIELDSLVERCQLLAVTLMRLRDHRLG